RRAVPGRYIFRDEKFWVPLIGIFSLMRLEEICQLHVGDLVQIDGIWMFRVTEDLSEVPHQRRLKNEASVRMVPVHKILLEIGILDLIAGRRNPNALLFPALKPSAQDGKLGTSISKWWTRYRRAHLGTTLLVNAGVPESWIDEISGHE